jgi:hypothetical protein
MKDQRREDDSLLGCCSALLKKLRCDDENILAIGFGS